MNDAGSLQNLNDIVVPAPVAWWPPAPGWYVLAGLLLLAAAAWGFLAWGRWKRNRYRRLALRELASMRRGETGLQQLPTLLKRAALSAWPRREVAPLSGSDWHRFLDRSAGLDRFCREAGSILDRLSYAVPAGSGVIQELSSGSPEGRAVLDAAEHWLRQHRAPEAD